MTDGRTAQERAAFPAEAAGILRARTLAADSAQLAGFLARQPLRSGQRVLDVGCGTGALTAGMAWAAPHAEVVGLDTNAALLEEARRTHAHLPHLSFRQGNVYDLNGPGAFDVVVAARVLQWLDRPREAITQMVAALKPGGRLFVLDYNHLRARLTPPPPPEMRHFRERYLAWRSEAGMDHEVADHLAGWLAGAGLTGVEVEPQHEETRRGDADFPRRIRLWADVARTRGLQVVATGFVTEAERQAAIEAFDRWVAGEAREQRFYLLSVTGVKPG